MEKYDESQETRSCFWKTVNIYRHDGRLYIKRLIILRCSLFSIMLHKIYLSDTDCEHSHPWHFISIILRGYYYEYTPKSLWAYMDRKDENVKRYSSPSILYRPAKWTHRLEVDESKPPVITLVLTGKKIQSWGFLTKLGFINWRTYRPTGSCE